MTLEVQETVVTPGDSVLKLPESGKLRVGAGLAVEQGCLVTSRTGIVRQTKSGKIWVEGRSKRYVPVEGDSVIGLILERYADDWSVDVGGPFPARLPALAFENITRRNRPNLQPGDLVFARVTSAPRDADPEVQCVDASNKSGGFGPLKEGFHFSCSTALCRKLLASPPAPVLSALGSSLQYEVAVGQNGRVWVHAPNTVTTIMVANAIQNSEFLSPAQADIMVKRLLAAVKAEAS